jgi:citrate lyase beta subunit
MSAVAHSRQALAAKRFVDATRSVDQAFRAVRRDPEDGTSADEHAAAVAQLDRALDELARAQALFDSVVRIDARRRN